MCDQGSLAHFHTTVTAHSVRKAEFCLLNAYPQQCGGDPEPTEHLTGPARALAGQLHPDTVLAAAKKQENNQARKAAFPLSAGNSDKSGKKKAVVCFCQAKK